MKKYLIPLFCLLILPFCLLNADAVLIGDVDGNADISAADARLALRASVSLEHLDKDALLAADTDTDGFVSATDARMILRASVSIERFAGEFTIDFIDVGQAKSILVQSGNETMLIDAGNRGDGDLVCDYLHAEGITALDYVVCTHAHEDHGGGLADVLNEFTVTQDVFAPSLSSDAIFYQDFLTECAEQHKTPRHPALGATLSFGESTIQFFGPAIADTTDLNNSSIVMKITYEDTSFLITGDAETVSEQEMLDLGFDLSADVLDVGHHGSNTSTSYVFLREIMPEFAVISCGADNEYGHPHEEVTSRLHDAGVVTYRTDVHGTVRVVSNGKALAFYTSTNADIVLPEKPSNPPLTTYIGNLNSKKFHLPTCGSLPAEHNRIYFASRAIAINEGYSPCGTCKP